MATHKLKTEPESFEPIVAGRKVAEFRKDDRNFNVGDILRLREWSKETSYTNQVVEVEVTHILRGPAFGVPEGYVMMSFIPAAGGDRPDAVIEYIAETWDMFSVFCDGRGINPNQVDATLRDGKKIGGE